MWLTSLYLHLSVFLTVVAIVTYFLRRHVGWGWLLVACLGLSGLATLPYVIWVYRISPLSPQETHTYARAVALTIGVVFLSYSGLVAWGVALIIPPRTAPADASSTEPPATPEDTHELLSLPRHYQALLIAHREARQQATNRPWYNEMFRAYAPTYVRENFNVTLQLLRAPDVLRRDFVAAVPVLTALSEMPTSRLSALEAYHRINLGRVRRRLIPARIIAGVLPPAVVLASRALPSLTADIAKWDAARASVFAFVVQPQHYGFLGGLIGVVLGVILSSVLAWLMQRRLEALGELLTIALADCRQNVVGDIVIGVGSPDDRVV